MPNIGNKCDPKSDKIRLKSLMDLTYGTDYWLFQWKLMIRNDERVSDIVKMESFTQSQGPETMISAKLAYLNCESDCSITVFHINHVCDVLHQFIVIGLNSHISGA